MSQSRFVTIKVEEVIRETDEAFLFLVDGSEVWLPKSQIEDVTQCTTGYYDLELSVTRWICEQKDLDYSEPS